MDEQERIDHATKLSLLNKKENERKDRVLNAYVNSEDYQAKLLLRAQLFDATKEGRRDFLLSRGRIYELCKGIQDDGSYDPAAGCIFFINNFGWTYAPKLVINNKKSKHLPFILFQFQEEALRWFIERIEKGEDAFAEKSRDMGASWILFVYVSLWYWLFKDGTNILMGSYKEMLVDDKTIDSLFGKLDYAMDSLPKWMIPKGFNKNKHRTKLKLVRPDNGNVITGDTMNPNFGRGSRKTAILFDELGFWDYSKDAWEGCYSPDTEILTKEGWKDVTNITKDDIVYSMNQETKESEWMPVLKTQKVFYEKMIHFDGKSIDLIVSPDHNMVFENNSGISLRTADEVHNLKSGSIPLTSNFVGEEIKEFYGYKTEDWLEFLGWYISEGWTCKSGTIGISQSNIVHPEFVIEIKILLDRMNISYSYNRNKEFYVHVKDLDINLREELKQLGKSDDKYIPNKYLNLSPRLLNILLDSLIKGDGVEHIRKDRTPKIAYYTISKRLANNIQEIVQKTGKRATIRTRKRREDWHTSYDININNKTKININKLKSNYIDYNDYAYCLTTPYHTLYVRRKGKAVWCGNCADSTNCRLANSTPNGYNYYAMLREMPISIHTMHWKEHPLKDDEWYEYEKTTRTPESLAQEVDISYSKSLEGKVYPDWNEVNIEQGVFEYDPYLPLYVGWDFGKTDDTAIIWVQPNRGKLRIIDVYRNAYKTIDFYTPFINGYVSSEHHNYTPADLEKIERHKYWKKGTHFGDPAGRFQNNVVDQTVIDVLREHGIIINFQDNWKHFKARKEATRHLILNGIELNMNSDTKWFNTCMMQAAYPKVKREGIEFTVSEKPKHDFTSHYRSAFEYLALGLRNFGKRKTEPVDKFKKGRFKKGRVVGY